MKSTTDTRRSKHQQPSSSSTPFFSVFSRSSSRMPTLFNIMRACLYAVILIWTVICFAIAVHFQGLLASSDLTRFVPFAIFVCVAGLLVILALIGFSFRRNLNPITIRLELICLAVAGTLWIALGAFLATSDSDDAEVECFSSATSTTPLDSSAPFNTETYHAQYRVLEAFSIFNAILFWGFFIFLLCITLRQHMLGETQVWHVPVTTYPFFNSYSKSSPAAKLPAPVTARSRSRGRAYNEKDIGGSRNHRGHYTGGGSRRDQRAAPSSDTDTSRFSTADRVRAAWKAKHSSNKPNRPGQAHTTDRYGKEQYQTHIHDKFARGASPRR